MSSASIEGALDTALAAYRNGDASLAANLLEGNRATWAERPDGWVLYGATQKALGRFTTAEDAYRQAIRLLPAYADAWHNLGNLYAAAGHQAAAADAYRQALVGTVGSIDRANVAILFAANAASAGRIESAIEALDNILTMTPAHANALNQRGKILWEVGDTEAAISAFRAASAAEPTNGLCATNLLLVSQFSEHVDAAALTTLAQRAAGLIEARVAPALRAAYTRPPIGVGRIRIAYLSSDFHYSAPGYFIRSILAGHDRERFEVWALSTVDGGDDWTAAMRADVDHWQEVANLDDASLTHLIRQLGIDILVDLNGYTGGHRLGVLAARAAPVQVSWLGYEGSTHLREMDVLIGDPHVTPRDTAIHNHEQVLRLPFDFACYTPPDYAPPVSPTPALRRGHITFGSFNKLAKLGPATLRLWARLLMAVPESRLLVKWRHAPTPLARQRIADIMTLAGISVERLEFRDASPHREMLGEYAEVDIALDPFPFSGGATTCEALWMGVPVVSLRGQRFASNHTVSHLCAAGLPELVAGDQDEYLAIGTRLASDLPALDRLRQSLRAQLALSPLCNARLFMGTVERHYENLLLATNQAASQR